VDSSKAMTGPDAVRGPDIVKGLVSERAIFLRAALKPHDWKLLEAQAVMTAPPVSVRALGSVGRAIFEMSDGKVRHVLVEPSESSSLSIISMRDVLRYVYEVLTSGLTEQPAQIFANPNGAEGRDLGNLLQAAVQVLIPHKPVTADPELSVQSAIEQMAKQSIGSILIAEKSSGKLLGIFTERDFLRKVATQNIAAADLKLGTVMTLNPKAILEGASVALALNLMFEGGFRHVPVVTEDNIPLGILSLRNFLTFLNQAVMRDLERKK